MKKGENFNRPKKGDEIKVQPIKKMKDIKAIKKLLAGKPLDYAIFVVGINTAFRASDLLRLKVKHVKDLAVGDSFERKEKKTKKENRKTLNQAAFQAIQALLKTRSYDDSDYLFLGQRGPLTVPTIVSKTKAWCKAINLKGNFGSHSLRKTWGYHQRVNFGTDIPTLMICFNHTTQKQTLDYLCIQPEEIKGVYLNEL